mmetsp:Transcript_2973/g.6681  ORF Transcript_2973/g.6681 Transcript_2973/m.6681 type:complete len:108 (+) Transcript_2973:1925-2248(+)
MDFFCTGSVLSGSATTSNARLMITLLSRSSHTSVARLRCVAREVLDRARLYDAKVRNAVSLLLVPARKKKLLYLQQQHNKYFKIGLAAYVVPIVYHCLTVRRLSAFP